MTVYGIYKNQELVYIGQTRNNPKNRICSHFSRARKKQDLGMPILRAMIKYGTSSFTWKILKKCNSLEDLNICEMNLIRKHSPRYNVAVGGQKGLGHSEKTRKKISEIQKKKIICTNDQICFFSVRDAEIFYKAAKGTIGRVARGHRNHYKGLKFKFINKSPMDKRAGDNKENCHS